MELGYAPVPKAPSSSSSSSREVRAGTDSNKALLPRPKARTEAARIGDAGD